MATFKSQIAMYAGTTTGYTTELETYLNDGVKEVVDTVVSANPDEAPNFSRETTLTDANPTLQLDNTDYVIDVKRYSTISLESQYRRCDRIKPHIIPEINNTDSIYYTTMSSPVYWILNQKLNVFPTPASGEDAKVTYIDYGDVNDNGGTIGAEEVTLTGITSSNTPDVGVNYIFTSVAHGLSEGDFVRIDDITTLTDWKGAILQVDYIDSDTFQLYGVQSIDGTSDEAGMDITREGTGFPSKYYPQVVRYASMRLLTQKAVDKRTGLPVLSLPAVPSEPDSPSFTYTPVEVSDVVKPLLNISDMVALEADAPLYQQPVVSLDFDKVQEFITDEDPEMVTAQLGKITAQVNEYTTNAQVEMNKFSEANTAYNEDIQRKTQNFQKEVQQAIQDVQNEMSVNSGNMSKEVQIALQNEVQAYQKEVQEYGSEMQRYGALVGTYQGEVQTAVQEFTANLQKETTDYQWIVGQLQMVKAEYDAFWAKYSKVGEQ